MRRIRKLCEALGNFFTLKIKEIFKGKFMQSTGSLHEIANERKFSTRKFDNIVREIFVRQEKIAKILNLFLYYCDVISMRFRYDFDANSMLF